MPLADTHCHLQDHRFDDDRPAVLERSLDALEWLVVIGDNLDTSRRAVAMTRDRVYAAIGFHPYHADRLDASALELLSGLAASERVVAIGEIGLDYYRYAETSPAEQRRAFEAQLELAATLRLPVIIHNREAAAVVPFDRLLVETDCPYLAPQPVRGKRCEPRYVHHTARCVADLKGVTLAEFAARTTSNAARLFRVAAGPQQV